MKPTKPLYEYPDRSGRNNPFLIPSTPKETRNVSGDGSSKWYTYKYRYRDGRTITATSSSLPIGGGRNAKTRLKQPDVRTNEHGIIYRISKAEEDPYAGLPEELRPIHPGGGSKFDDWEKEKLEKNKLALKKELEAANARHDAESFRSNSVGRELQLGICLYFVQFILLVYY